MLKVELTVHFCCGKIKFPLIIDEREFHWIWIEKRVPKDASEQKQMNWNEKKLESQPRKEERKSPNIQQISWKPNPTGHQNLRQIFLQISFLFCQQISYNNKNKNSNYFLKLPQQASNLISAYPEDLSKTTPT